MVHFVSHTIAGNRITATLVNALCFKHKLINLLPTKMTSKTKKTTSFFFKLYRPLLIGMQLCGFNVLLTNNFLPRLLFFIYTLILVNIVSYSMMTCCPDQEISLIWSLIEYVVFVMFMIFYKTKVYIYFQKLENLDGFLRINHRRYYKTRRRIFFIVFFVWLIGVVYSLAYCFITVCFTSLLTFAMYQLCLLALDINRVWRYGIFEAILSRLRLLRVRLEENPGEDYYLYVNDNKLTKENKIKMCMKLYMNIADALDVVSTELNASLLIGIICSLPKLIVNVYRILLVVDNVMAIETLGFMLTNIFQTCLFIFSPCVVIEMYGAEVHKIRQFLMHNLMFENDCKSKEDIQLFIQYTDIRPFRYKIWRVIPMGMTMPLEIINLCTTYVIVIVNITKLFDA